MKRPKAWVILVGIALAAALLSSCTVYAVAKKEVFPAAKQVVISAGPHLVEAAIQDIAALIGWPVDQIEGIVGYGGPTDTAPTPK